MVFNASRGYLPIVVSEFSNKQSAPSITAEWISVTSALKGKGLLTIESRKCEAKIQGFAAWLQNLITLF
jgi:hypothetical protein